MILNKEKLDQVLTELGKQFIPDYKPELKYSHKSDYTRVRAVISYWLRHTHLFTFQAIANLFGVHYATIMYQCKRIEDDLSIKYRETKIMLETLSNIISNKPKIEYPFSFVSKEWFLREQMSYLLSQDTFPKSKQLSSALSNMDVTSTISIKSDITLSCTAYHNEEGYTQNMVDLLEQDGFFVESDDDNNVLLSIEKEYDLSTIIIPIGSVLMVLTLPIPTMTQFFYVLDYNEFQLLLPQQ